MSQRSPAYDQMRLVAETLVTDPASIRERIMAAARAFPEQSAMRTNAERGLWLRIGSSLVEGGPEGHEGEEDYDERHVAESVAALDERRLSEIARDMLLLYEHTAGIRTDPDAPWEE